MEDPLAFRPNLAAPGLFRARLITQVTYDTFWSLIFGDRLDMLGNQSIAVLRALSRWWTRIRSLDTPVLSTQEIVCVILGA